MKAIEIMNRIGLAVFFAGIALAAFGVVRNGQGTGNDLTGTLGIIGAVAVAVGLILVNFKSEWLFEE